MQENSEFVPGFLTNDVPVLIISLNDQLSRRDDLVARGVPKRWVQAYFPAVDLRDALEDEIAPLCDLVSFENKFCRKMRAAEVGCTMSHNGVASWLATSSFQIALVLEDDVIPNSPDWIAQVASISKALIPHAQSGAAFICHLGAPSSQVFSALKRKVIWQDGQLLINTPDMLLHADPAKDLWRAHAYLISVAAAARSSNQETKVMTLADDWCERRRRGWLDEIFFTPSVLIGQDVVRPSTIRPFDHDDVSRTTVTHVSLMVRIGQSLSDGSFLKRFYNSLRFRLAMVIARLVARSPYYVCYDMKRK